MSKGKSIRVETKLLKRVKRARENKRKIDRISFSSNKGSSDEQLVKFQNFHSMEDIRWRSVSCNATNSSGNGPEARKL